MHSLGALVVVIIWALLGAADSNAQLTVKFPYEDEATIVAHKVWPGHRYLGKQYINLSNMVVKHMRGEQCDDSKDWKAENVNTLWLIDPSDQGHCDDEPSLISMLYLKKWCSVGGVVIHTNSFFAYNWHVANKFEGWYEEDPSLYNCSFFMPNGKVMNEWQRFVSEAKSRSGKLLANITSDKHLANIMNENVGINTIRYGMCIAYFWVVFRACYHMRDRYKVGKLTGSYRTILLACMISGIAMAISWGSGVELGLSDKPPVALIMLTYTELLGITAGVDVLTASVYLNALDEAEWKIAFLEKVGLSLILSDGLSYVLLLTGTDTLLMLVSAPLTGLHFFVDLISTIYLLKNANVLVQRLQQEHSMAPPAMLKLAQSLRFWIRVSCIGSALVLTTVGIIASTRWDMNEGVFIAQSFTATLGKLIASVAQVEVAAFRGDRTHGRSLQVGMIFSGWSRSNNKTKSRTSQRNDQVHQTLANTSISGTRTSQIHPLSNQQCSYNNA